VDRKTFIGGTDIAVIMGLSPYKTPYKLWAEKTGLIEQDDLSNVEAVQLGIELEEFVAKKFEKVTGLKVRRPPVSHYYREDNEVHACQVDRLIEGTNDLLEVKTASLRKEKDWVDDQIPAHYIMQVQWQLYVTGRTTGYIAVLIGGQKFVWKKVVSDAQLISAMVKAANEFWGMVQSKTAPSVGYGDDEAILKVHPRSDGDIEIVEEMNTAIARRQELSMHIDNMEKEKEEIEAKLKACIGDKLGIQTSQYKVMWTPTSTSRVDTEALKTAGIYEQYLKKSDTRRLTIKGAK
jgi:putative phage-type endonuclease